MEDNTKRGARAWCSWRRRFLGVVWRDKKLLNLISNRYDRPRTQRKQQTKEGEKIRVPQVVEDYRSSLNCVDRANGYRLRYYFWHRTMKNTRVQFNNMVLMCVVNAWILFCSINKVKMSYKAFFVKLAEELAERGGVHRQRKRSHSEMAHKNATSHIVVRVEQRGTCAYCKTQGSSNRNNCSTRCNACNAYLHADQKNCFAHFHGVKLD
jgi:hypothetical protein